MSISLFVAKLLGVYLVVSGLFLLFRGKTVAHMMKDFFDHPAVIYLTGTILVFLSSIMLLKSNIWDGTWRTIVTVIMWLLLIKGLAYIFVPEMLRKMVSKKFLEAVNLYGLIAIAAGIYLFYVG